MAERINVARCGASQPFEPSADEARRLADPLTDLVVGAERHELRRRVPAGPVLRRALVGDGAVSAVDGHREVDQVDMLDPGPDPLDLDAVRPDQLARVLDVD